MDSLLLQITDITRGTLRPAEAALFALQCVAWAKQAERTRVAGPTTDSSILLKDRFQQAWTQLSAFRNAGIAFDRRFEFFEHLTEAQLRAVVGAVNSRDPVADESLIEIALRAADPTYTLAPDAQLTELLVALCQIEPGDRIYCPYDETLRLSVACAKNGAQVTARVQAHSPVTWLVNLILETEISIEFGDILDTARQSSDRYDKTVALLPAGRLTNSRERGFASSATTLEMAGLEHALHSTSRRVVVAVVPRLAFGSGGERELRKNLVDSQRVEAVIALPTGLVHGTGLALRILVLDLIGGRTAVQMVDATEPPHVVLDTGKRVRLADPKKLAAAVLGAEPNTGRAVLITDIEASDFSFEPRRFIASNEGYGLNPALRSAVRVRLEDIAEFVRPLPTKRTPGSTEIFEISAADLPDYGYVQLPQKSTKVDLSTIGEAPFVRPKDIVLITKGSVGSVGIIPHEAPKAGRGGWAVGQSGIIIRVRDHSVIDPRALLSYLRSTVGQNLLTAGVSVSTTRMLQLAPLKSLPVVIPPRELSEQIVSAWEEQRRIEDDIIRLRQRQAELRDHLWTAGRARNSSPA